MEDVRTLKYFKFIVVPVCALVILFLIFTYKAPDEITTKETLSGEVVSSEEQTSSFYVLETETETETTQWMLGDMEIQTLELGTKSNINNVSEEDVNGVTLYKSNINWTKGYLTSDEFWVMCVTAGKLYRESINKRYGVSVRCPTEDEMMEYVQQYLYRITDDYKLVLRVYVTLRNGEFVIEEGTHELTIVYDVDHLVLESE